MTAVTPGREELRGEIAQALCCHGECIRGEAACWKYTTSGHKKITDAILAIFDRLAAKPDEGPDAINEKRAAEDAKLASNVVNECARFLNLHATEMRSNSLTLGPSGLDAIAEAMKRNPVLLSTTGKPKP